MRPDVAQNQQIIAIRAIGFIASNERTAQRFLDLTGLTIEELRGSLEEPAVQVAALDFLSAYEPDLIACAEALGIEAEALAALSASPRDSL